MKIHEDHGTCWIFKYNYFSRKQFLALFEHRLSVHSWHGVQWVRSQIIGIPSIHVFAVFAHLFAPRVNHHFPTFHSELVVPRIFQLSTTIDTVLHIIFEWFGGFLSGEYSLAIQHVHFNIASVAGCMMHSISYKTLEQP